MVFCDFCDVCDWQIGLEFSSIRLCIIVRIGSRPKYGLFYTYLNLEVFPCPTFLFWPEHVNAKGVGGLAYL
jgi:hypothetical protein